LAIWDDQWIKGTFGERSISDRPEVDSSGTEQGSGIDARKADYPGWRSKFRGDHLKQSVDGKPIDPAEENFRYPTRLNLFKSYSLMHAATLWGRGETAHEATSLFEIELGKKVPGLPGAPPKSAGPEYRDYLDYWWGPNQHMLRPAAATQMWAGDCILKVTWLPHHPEARYGCVLEALDPETVYPIWDPLSHTTLMGAKIQFKVPVAVAIDKYGMDRDQVKKLSDNGEVQVTEFWTRSQYATLLGPPGHEQVARVPNVAGFPGELMAGPNEWVDPMTNRPILPIFYTPRIRTDGFFGDSLVEELVGGVEEINKALSDMGDAINDATHISGFIADDHSTLRRSDDLYIEIPRGELRNLGRTGPEEQQGKFMPMAAPKIPDTATKYVDLLSQFTDMVAFLTPAAKGQSQGTSGFAVAMEMMPTLYLMDWMRSHWSKTITQINHTLGVIWFHKHRSLPNLVPSVTAPRVLHLEQMIRYRHITPRDRMASIQEITSLATANVLPPSELIRRLGDVEDVEAVLGELQWHVMIQAAWDAAVAGHGLTIGQKPKGVPDEIPAMPLPELVGEQGPKPKPVAPKEITA
jgi:hypothetical protein